jgi:adenylate kinase
MLPNIHLIGIQGSGKGTQAALLVQRFGLTYVGSGNLLRKRARVGDAYAKNLDKLLCAGKLVPNHDLEKVVTEHIRQTEIVSGLVGDGVLRTLEQYRMFESVWPTMHLDRPLFIQLVLSDKLALERIQQRTQEKEQNRQHHLVYGGKLLHRADDNPAAIEQRIGLFHQMTQPMLTVAQAESRCVTVDAAQPIDAVHDAIVKNLVQIYPSFIATHGAA